MSDVLKGKKVKVLAKKLRYYDNKRYPKDSVLWMREDEIYNKDAKGNNVLSPHLELVDETKPQKVKPSKPAPIVQDDEVI